MKLALTVIDYICSIIFGVEAVLKIVAFGFIFNGKSSYLRNYWNLFDFTIITLTVTSHHLNIF
jgi:hypothetical protein